jgi:uncharacterized damage-inducible protein DinB
MPSSNPIEILLKHDRWATRQILQQCAALTPEQLDQKFEIGPGSLRAAALHLVSAQRTWCDTLAGRPVRPHLDKDVKTRTPAEIMALQDEVAPEFIALVAAHPPEQTVTRERGGKTHTFTRGAVLAHVLVHGAHHRAQCINMLRRLGVTPLPPSSVIEWAFMEDN